MSANHNLSSWQDTAVLVQLDTNVRLLCKPRSTPHDEKDSLIASITAGEAESHALLIVILLPNSKNA